jgi:hypothetical protein
MKNCKISQLVIFLALLIFSCNDEGGNPGNKTDSPTVKKPNVQPNAKAFDTASFLKQHNLVMSTLTDIPANSTIYLPGTNVFYPVLNMGDRSKLIIPNEFTNVTIYIARGTFGEETEIVADGRNGANGVKLPDPWDKGWWQADEGDDGAKGVNGTNGENGRSGVPRAKIQIGIVSLVSLSIHANGGNGGNGGDAGKGQLGGNKSGPFGSNGGGSDGGDAGNGGNGGDGGNIQIEIWGADGPITSPSSSQLSSIARGGLAGRGGKGGAPNEGGNHGQAGEPGKNGKNGRNGFEGSVPITLVPKPLLP